MTIDRSPWWGMLVKAPLEEGTREIEASLDARYDEDDYTIVAGDGWIGFYCFHPESTIDFDVVDRVRARGREVIALDHGDEPGVYRFVEDELVRERVRPDEVEAEHGVTAPDLTMPAPREERTAAVVVGRTRDEVRAVARPGVEVRPCERGVLALGDRSVLLDFHDQPDVTLYTVTHYLDNDELDVVVQRGTDLSRYSMPPDEVEGETDRRKVIVKLGIPVEFMFP